MGPGMSSAYKGFKKAHTHRRDGRDVRLLLTICRSSCGLSRGKPASAKGKVTIPPGGCAYQKSAIANYAFCSFDCDAATNWCSQQMCTNGALTKVVPCYGTFCAAKCGG